MVNVCCSTGAGKTIITNLINRFYEIEQGRITVDGIDIKRIRKDSLRDSSGMVLQDTHLFDGSVMENIRYGRREPVAGPAPAAGDRARRSVR
jgi:ATP-binding cassette, subfamily B, multidrug efflux pump